MGLRQLQYADKRHSLLPAYPAKWHLYQLWSKWFAIPFIDFCTPPRTHSLANSLPGISRLDSAIAHAEKYGVKLVLPFLNNWDDLGGINSYTAAFGGNATTFFTDAKSQEAYKGWIEFAINRYKNSSAIFAWELCNEPRCHGCDSSVIYDWASDISAYIKSLDSTHMVTLGDEGWFNGTYGDGSYAYSGAEGVDFLQNINIPTLDYAVMHLYPDSWGYANESWGNGWIEQHADAAKKAGKPVVLEEYGYGYGTDAQREAVEVPWQQTALESGIAMDQIWQFGTALPSGNKPDDGNTVFYNTTKGSLYDVVVLQNVKAMRKAPLVQ